jgi:uncharacterized protein (TIGR03085 family)
VIASTAAATRIPTLTLLGDLGPGAPTLLAPWTARDLAAHLVLRERDPLAGPGLVLSGAWRRLAQQRQSALAGRDFSLLVGALRSGPPPGFFRLGWVRRLPGLNEFFVHHEDLRRANGRGPRPLGRGMDEALWRNVGRAPWLLARRLRGAGLELQRAGTGRAVRARRGEPTARIAGPPGELLLYLFGRTGAAQVQVSGPGAAADAVRRTRFGMQTSTFPSAGPGRRHAERQRPGQPLHLELLVDHRGPQQPLFDRVADGLLRATGSVPCAQRLTEVHGPSSASFWSTVIFLPANGSDQR